MFAKKSFITFLFSCFITGSALANPTGGVVSSGDATITQSANQTTIQQNSQKAIINWQSFNIGANEKTHFEQPQGGIALNRINATQGPSQIYGQLTATGKIILVNQAGVFFGPGSYVNVGGIIASTSNISDQNFLAGKLIFDQPSPFHGTVINKGTIIAATNGLVALIGNNVSNDGMIQAEMGNVVLASGNKFTIDLYGDQLINFTVDEGITNTGSDQNGNPMQDAVKNTGTILADGGHVLLTAQAAAGVVDNAINMSGVIQAHSVNQQNGDIILSSDAPEPVVVSGLLDASGTTAGQTGGTVKVLGAEVGLTDNTKIDVSGDQGGGTALIGGNAHGAGPEQNANYTYVGPNAVIDASALTNGNGGEAVVWSNIATQFYGNILAEGGAQGGNGGWVETSSHNYLDMQGTVNSSALNGMVGTWLLDPANVVIEDNGGTNSNITDMSNIFEPDSSASSSILDTTKLESALQNNSIEVTTTNNGTDGGSVGNITVSGPSTLSWSTANSLTLMAVNNIAINAPIDIVNSGGELILNSPGTITQSAGISGAGGVTIQGTSATLATFSGDTYTGKTQVQDGTFTLPNNSAISTASEIDVSSGATVNFSLPTTGPSSDIWAYNIHLVGSGVGGAGALTVNDNNNLVESGIETNFVLEGDTTFGFYLNNSNSTLGFLGNVWGAPFTTGGGVTGNGALTITTSGPSNINGIRVLYGMSYVGSTTLNIGGPQINVDNPTINFLPTTTTLNITTSGSPLEYLGNASQTVAGLTGTGTIKAASGTSTFEVNNTSDMTFDGVFSQLSNGSLAIDKNGSGKLTLTQTQLYNGGTTISGGTLELASPSLLNSNNVTFSGGGVLKFTNTNISITSGTFTFGSGGGEILMPASSTFSDSGSLAGSGNITFDGSNSATTFTLSSQNSNSGVFSLLNGTLIANNANSILGSTTGFVLSSGTVFNMNNHNETIGALSGAGNITMGSGNLTINQGSNGIYTGVLNGTGNLTKNGNSNLSLEALGGSNNYSGTTTVSAGDLLIDGDTEIGTGILTLNGGYIGVSANASSVTLSSSRAISIGASGGGFAPTDGTTLTYNGTINASGNLLIKAPTGNTGSGVIDLGSTMNQLLSTAGTILNSGTLRLTSNNVLPTGNITFTGVLNTGHTDYLTNILDLNNTMQTVANINQTSFASLATQPQIEIGSGQLIANLTGNQQFYGNISGTGNITFNNLGSISLYGTNTIGSMTLNGDDIELVSATAVNANTVISMSNSATLSFYNNTTVNSLDATDGTINLYNDAILTTGDSNNHTIGSGISLGSLIKQGAGSLTLSNANSFDFGTTVNGGTLILTNDNAVNAGVTVNSGGTVQINDGVTISQDMTINGAGAASTNGALVGVGNAAETGTITLGSDAQIGANTSATLTLNNIINNNNLTFGGQGDINPTGVISGSGALIMSGSGNLILTGSNDYTGTTTINAGTLQVGSNGGTTGSLGTGAVTLGSSGGSVNTSLVFDRSDSTTVGNAITLNNDSTLSQNGSTSLTLTGGIALDTAASSNEAINVASGTLNINTNGLSGGNDSGATSSTLNINSTGSGTLVINPAGTEQGNFNIVNGTLKINNNTALGLLAPTPDTATTIGVDGLFEIGSNVTNLDEPLVVADSTASFIHVDTLTTTTLSGNIHAFLYLNIDNTNSSAETILTGVLTVGSSLILDNGSFALTNNNSIAQTDIGNGNSTTVYANNNNVFGTGSVNIANNVPSFLSTQVGGLGVSLSNAIYLTDDGGITIPTSGLSPHYNLTLTGPVQFNENTIFPINIVDSGSTVTITGNISDLHNGSTPLEKSGAGTLVLGGTNSFLSPIVINAGKVEVTSGSSLGDGTDSTTAVTVDSGAELNINNTTLINPTTPYTITVNDGGKLSLTDATSIPLNVSIDAAGSGISGSGAIAATSTAGTNTSYINSPIILNGTTKISSNANDTLVIDGTITGNSNELDFAGGGQINLFVPLTNITTLNSGVATLGINDDITTTISQIYNNVDLFGNSTFNSSGGSITINGTIDGTQNLTIANGSGTIAFNGNVGGTAPLTSLTIGTSDTTTIGAGVDITTNNDQTYNSSIDLSGNAILNMENPGTISLDGVTGTNTNLTINANNSTSGTSNIIFNNALSSTLTGTSVLQVNGGPTGAETDTITFAQAGGGNAVSLSGTGAHGFDGSSNLTANMLFNNIDNITVAGTGNSLTGAPGNSVWQLSSNNNGSYINTNTLGFNNFNTLNGSSGNDSFTLTDATNVSETINGGSGTNSLSNGNSNANNFIISGADSGTLGSASTVNLTFSNISDLTADSSLNQSTFHINSSGSINSIQSNSNFTNIDYSNFGSGVTLNLTGGNSGNSTNVNSFSYSPGVFVGSITLSSTGGNDLVVGPSGTFSGTINGGGSGAVNTVDASAAATPLTINLNSNSASFGATLPNFSNFIGTDASNPTDNSTLIGPNARGSGTTNWTISSTNSGGVAGYTFSGFGSITGNANNKFIFSGSGYVTEITGGYSGGILRPTAATNILDFSGLSPIATLNVQLSGGTNLGVSGSLTAVVPNFSNISSVKGNNSGSNTLTGSNSANTWTISSTNGGTYIAGSANASFSNFQKLVGGTGGDTYNIDSSGSVNSIVGGIGGAEILSYSNYGNGVSVNLATASGSGVNLFNNITQVVGDSNYNGTLHGYDGAVTWDMTGANAGTVDSSLGFNHFSNLMGSTSGNTFTFESGSSIASIDGNNLSGNTMTFADNVVMDLTVNTAGGVNGAGSVNQVSNSANVVGAFDKIQSATESYASPGYITLPTGNTYTIVYDPTNHYNGTISDPFAYFNFIIGNPPVPPTPPPSPNNVIPYPAYTLNYQSSTYLNDNWQYLIDDAMNGLNGYDLTIYQNLYKIDALCLEYEYKYPGETGDRHNCRRIDITAALLNLSQNNN